MEDINTTQIDIDFLREQISRRGLVPARVRVATITYYETYSEYGTQESD